MFNYSYHHLHKLVLEFPHGWSNRYHHWELCFYDATFLISQYVHLLFRNLRRKSSSLLQIITHRSVIKQMIKKKLNSLSEYAQIPSSQKASQSLTQHIASRQIGPEENSIYGFFAKIGQKMMWKYTPHRPSENSSRKIYFSSIDNTQQHQHSTKQKSLCTGYVGKNCGRSKKVFAEKITICDQIDVEH